MRVMDKTIEAFSSQALLSFKPQTDTDATKKLSFSPVAFSLAMAKAGFRLGLIWPSHAPLGSN